MTSRPAQHRTLLASAPLVGALLLGSCTAGAEPAGVAPGAGGERPAPGATSATPARCSESGVLIRSTGSDAAMGLRALGLELVNCGTAPTG
ncbi:hypothetical protein [Micromonospora sp. WMMD812]|uniref:hypothetical protein n=1 Tax=Micromonospora sp. WMMD812 TaxID=3015152 RepID=UPI00248BB419|nr:hypothetical protein [Micromonospora sp. WMMD812]WBB66153.1 hypothetical protein O7603_23705 [Micromonospora sp. WMMD812]